MQNAEMQLDPETGSVAMQVTDSEQGRRIEITAVAAQIDEMFDDGMFDKPVELKAEQVQVVWREPEMAVLVRSLYDAKIGRVGMKEVGNCLRSLSQPRQRLEVFKDGFSQIVFLVEDNENEVAVFAVRGDAEELDRMGQNPQAFCDAKGFRVAHSSVSGLDQRLNRVKAFFSLA